MWWGVYNALMILLWYCNINDIVDELFKAFLSRFQIGLETSVRERERERERESDFVFDSIQLLYYKCHRIIFICSGLYTDSLHWMKKENSNNKTEK